MQSFGWKRKARLSRTSRPAVFGGDNNESETKEDADVDWLTATKRPKVLQLEDVKAKARRLSNEGVTLAEAERWWAAIGRWNSALALTPDDHSLHEMMSQAYMQVGEVYPALRSAEEAVRLAPNWWIGLQTLGRAQLGLGEVSLAVKSFSRAIHISPDQQDLWREDLQWAVGLLKNYKEIQAEKEKVRAAAREAGATITELPEYHIEGTVRERSLQIYRLQQLEAAEKLESSENDRDKNIDISKMVRMRVT